MAKYYGEIGYSIATQTSPGVWEEIPDRRKYYGDVIRDVRKSQSSGSVNDNVVLANEISIIADQFANENMQFIRYAEFMGVKWKVLSIEVKRPRLILTIGGVYNG